MTHSDNQKQAGFALLITIIVLSVVLAIGLSLLEISLKQINLTITARESELAFVAANSGVECAQFSRFNIEQSTDFDDGQFRFACFNQGARTLNVNGGNPAGSSATQTIIGNAASPNRAVIESFQTQYDLETEGGEMCVDMTVVTIDVRGRATGYPYSFSNQGVVSRNCPGNSVCTNIFSRGYNRSCGDIGDRNTVQREMTAEF
jgi:Tfp pilus assembly protein PilX